MLVNNSFYTIYVEQLSLPPTDRVLSYLEIFVFTDSSVQTPSPFYLLQFLRIFVKTLVLPKAFPKHEFIASSVYPPVTPNFHHCITFHPGIFFYVNTCIFIF